MLLAFGIMVVIPIAFWGWHKIFPPTIGQRLNQGNILIAEAAGCEVWYDYNTNDEPCQENLRSAAVEYRSVIRMQPSSAEAYMGLGSVYLSLDGKGDKEDGYLVKALTNWRKAVQLEPKSAYAHSKLAQTLYYLGQHAASDREERIAHLLWAHRGSYMWTIPHDSEKNPSKRK